MKYTPPITPPPKRNTPWIRLHIGRLKGTAFIEQRKRVNQPWHTIEIERRKAGDDWSGCVRDERGTIVFNGYLDGSEDATAREAICFLMEKHGLR
jgi:hypothetical protein